MSDRRYRLQPGEPAQVLLELRDQLGPSVLLGTLYQEPSAIGLSNPDELRPDEPAETVSVSSDEPAQSADLTTDLSTPDENDGGAFVESIRAMDAERESDRFTRSRDSDRRSTAAPVWEPVRGAVDRAVAPADHSSEPAAPQVPLIHALRKVSRQLDQTADVLEEHNLYFRADQLRELAQELRQEARSAQGGWSLQPVGSVQPAKPLRARRDVARELVELYDELRRAQRPADPPLESAPRSSPER